MKTFITIEGLDIQEAHAITTKTHSRISSAQAILDAASSMTFTPSPSEAPSKGKGKSQRAAKNARKAAKLDLQPFLDHDVPVPASKEAAEKLICEVINGQLAILRVGSKLDTL